MLAVWVGNFDGRRNPAFIGRTCAGPLLFQMIDSMRLQSRSRPPPIAPGSGVEMTARTGKPPQIAAPREALHWHPAPGVHHLKALDDRGRSSTCKVTLQTVAAK